VLVARVPNPSDAAVTFLRANISLTELRQRGGEQLMVQVMNESTKRIAGEGFEINPRYGTFNAETLEIGPTKVNWLVDLPSEDTPSEADPSPAPSN
jgi:hypothetical protein